jgi:hypothetical protein
MSSSFPSRIRHTQKGDPVSAGIASSAAKTLEGRTNYLKEQLSTIEAGQALIQRDVLISSDALVGQPVYWDSTNQYYAPAKAGVSSDPVTSGLIPSDASDVVGMVLAKKAGNLGDIVLWGLVHFTDLSNTIDDTPIETGRYYLSAQEAGKLLKQRPPETVSVCLVYGPLDACDTGTWVFVMPQMRDFLEDHVHYSFNLVAQPAGDTEDPGAGNEHVIQWPDATKQGWLPANHASFNEKAPAGAYFGYNLAAHPELEQLWPPIPVTSVVLESFKPDDGDRVGGRVPPEKIVFDQWGIWWMTSCYGEVPWPTDLSIGSSSSSSSSLSSDSAQICPVPTTMELVLSFIKMTFATDKTVVTSLQPGEDQEIQFVNGSGEIANTGDLFAQLLLALLIDTPEYYGGQSLKGVTADNKFESGYAVEGLVAGSSKVSLSSTHNRYLTPGDDSTPTVHQEIVTVDVTTDPTDRELLPQIVVLGDALERLYKNIPYIGFPTGRDSGIRVKFVVPPEGLPNNPTLKIRVVIFGRGDGTMTDMDTSYYRFARPAPITPVAEGDTALVLDTNVAVTTDNAVEVESETFVVAPGDTVLVSIDRAAAGSPTYAFEMGIIRVGAILEGS